MNDAAYHYMCKDEVLWFCQVCSNEVRSMIKDVTQISSLEPVPSNPGTSVAGDGCVITSTSNDPVIVSIRHDLDSTIMAMKTLVEDFKGFIHGKGNPGSTQDNTTNQSSTQSGSQETRVKTVEDDETGEPGPWARIDKPCKSFKDLLREANEESRREGEEEAKRKKNIIIHRFPEDDSETWEARKECDKHFLHTLFDTLEVNPNFDSFQRLGKRSRHESNGNQRQTHRPLRVTFNSEEDTKLILKNLGKLRESAIDSVRITPDLNLKEREAQRELVEKAKNLTRQETGDYIHLVRGRGIIRVKRRNDGTIRSFNIPMSYTILKTVILSDFLFFYFSVANRILEKQTFDLNIRFPFDNHKMKY